MAHYSRQSLGDYPRFQYNFESSFVGDEILDSLLSQVPLEQFETDTRCIDPGVLAQIDSSATSTKYSSWESFPKDTLLLGEDMKEWMVDDCNKENMPSPKRKKSDPSGTSQFGAKVCSPRSIAKASKGFVPPNTAASTRWAHGNFDAWQVWKNGMNLGDPVPDNLLESRNADELNKWLSLYVKETKRQDGESYPTSTKNQLLSGLKWKKNLMHQTF